MATNKSGKAGTFTINSPNTTTNKSGTSGTSNRKTTRGLDFFNMGVPNPSANNLNDADDKTGEEGTFTIPADTPTGLTFNNLQPTEEEQAEEEEVDPYAITDQQRIAARNQTKLSRGNRQSVWNQLSRQLATYDYADAQNRALADAQRMQNSRKTNTDRFEAQRDLQSAALGILGSMGNAMNGSATGNLMRMLESRNDKENNTYLSQLQQNQDAVENAYQDALNQNNVNRLDVRNSADKAIDDIQADWYANINNINPRLHDQYYGENEDGTKLEWNLPNVNTDTFNGGRPFESLDYQYDLSYLNDNNRNSFSGYVPPQMNSNYILPDNTVRSTGGQANPSKSRNIINPLNDYFSQLMNGFNGYNYSTRRR